jgi:hypothetical protein
MEDPHPPGEATLFYHTQGNSFGPIPREHLARLWLTGSIPAETLVFIATSGQWEPIESVFRGLGPIQRLGEFQPPGQERPQPIRTPESAFRQAKADVSAEDNGPKAPSTPKTVRQWQTAFVGAVVLGCIAAAGSYFFAAPAGTELARRASEVQALKIQLAERDSAIERLKNARRTELSPNEIQGRFELPAGAGDSTAVAGVKVILHRRADIEKYLAEALAKVDPAAPAASLASSIVNNLPFPLASTATDSNGFYSLELPEAGDFVLHTNIVDPEGNAVMWFLAFNPSAPNHGPIDFKKSNAATRLAPGFIITNAR